MTEIQRFKKISSLDKAVISMTVHLDYKGEDILTELTTELYTFFEGTNRFFHKQLRTAEVVCRTANYFKIDKPEKDDKLVLSGSFAKDIHSNAYSKADKEFYDFLLQEYTRLIVSLPNFEDTDTFEQYKTKIETFFKEKGYEDLDFEERILTTTAQVLFKKGDCVSQTTIRTAANLFTNQFTNADFVRSAAILNKETNAPDYEIVISSAEKAPRFFDALKNDVSSSITEKYNRLVPMSQRELVIADFEDQNAKDFFDVLFEVRKEFPAIEKQVIDFFEHFATAIMQNKIILETKEPGSEIVQ
jgi:hypothetical protein